MNQDLRKQVLISLQFRSIPTHLANLEARERLGMQAIDMPMETTGEIADSTRLSRVPVEADTGRAVVLIVGEVEAATRTVVWTT